MAGNGRGAIGTAALAHLLSKYLSGRRELVNMQFEFATGGRIVFGAGALQRVGELLSDFGPRLLIIEGKDAGRSKPLTERLEKPGIELIEFRVTGEPTVELIDRGVRLARSSEITGVIGFGGGSVIDSA